MVNAARVARVLRLSPLEVLDTDTPTYLLLLAAVRVCQADDKAEAERVKRGGHR